MARHFLQLYLLIVVTLAAVSWGQDRLWEAYSRRFNEGAAAENRALAAALTLVDAQLRDVPPEDRSTFVDRLATQAGIRVELFEPQDIAGADIVSRLARGETAYLRAGNEDWLLRRISDEDRVLVFRYDAPPPQRGILDWGLSFIFYAAIALVIMAWLWPLTRDLRQLERSTARFGNRNWTFDARIGARSPVYPLAQAFRRMATRIDSLIRSQKDMSNAMSHEIKTPLARMRFELEMARTAPDAQRLAEHLSHIDTDIAELDAFVTATLDYAILERAEVALNVGDHDFTQMLPVLAESIKRAARPDLVIDCNVAEGASRVTCDAHLMETVVRNLLYNASRYARSRIRMSFFIRPDGTYDLHVDDDGPGIPEADRERVFGSFVQLDASARGKSGYGLGLAIVKRIVEWHGGEVFVTRSDLGGAGFRVQWGFGAPSG